MSVLSYLLEPKQDHLLIHIQPPGQKRLLYKDHLLSFAKEGERAAVEYLIQERLRATSAQPHAVVFNEIAIPKERSSEALKRLACTGSVYWKGKRLFIDPFTPVTLECSLFFQEDGALIVEGFLRAGKREKPLSHCEELFAGQPPWFIADGVLQFFQERIDAKWLKMVFPQPSQFVGEARDQLCALLEEGDLAFAPHFIWKNRKPQDFRIAALPFLVLKDRSGGFADLWFDYGSHGKVEAHQERVSWRNAELEKSWERDLIETGFQKKLLANSHYYCPLDKVFSCLSFLLDVGWKILDHKGRELIKQSGIELGLQACGQEVLVQGRVRFGTEQLNLSEALVGVNRQELFLAISEHTIGLLDHVAIHHLCGDLLTEEVTKEGVRIKTHQFGLLEPLFENPLVQKSPELQREYPLPSQPGIDFLGELYPYQQEGLSWMQSLFFRSFSGLLADEMGLGKTVQVLAFLSTLNHSTSTLIIVPTSLLFNWKKELEKFLPGRSVYLHSGSERVKHEEMLQSYPLILTSYAVMRLDAPLFQRVPFTCVILDEAQQIKNPDSQIARQVFQLKATFRLAMTGTPIENRIEELWSLFHFLIPQLLGDKQTFAMRMSLGSKKIKRCLKPFILRRRKEEVVRDLPPQIHQHVWISMSDAQKEVYDTWVSKQRLGLLKKIAADGVHAHRMEILEAILRLRQIVCHPLLVDPHFVGESAKLSRLMDDLEEAIQEKRKVLIYSQFTQMLSLMKQEVEQRGWLFVQLDGSTTDRETPVNRFQEEPDLLLFFISLKAGGVGLNLTAADTVILFDPWWNEAQEQQAISRAHRIGRSSAVIAKRYVTVGSIEEKMLQLKKQKSALAESLFDQEFDASAELTLDDLYALLS